MSGVSVAIPTLDGAAELDRTLTAVGRQTVPAEVVVLDSSSTDGTRDVARRHGARVETLARAAFGHGSARNRLMELTSGDRVAFLTQDAEPATARWLERLLDGLDREADVALAYGPYLPREDTSAATAREYRDFFAQMAGPDDEPCVRRAADVEGDGPSAATFASSANLCLTRRAWRSTPFRDVAYAEDQLLARDLLASGAAKCFVPGAGVLHAHAYPPLGRLRRSFDESRALHELYGWTPAARPRVVLGTVRAEVRRDRAFARATGMRADRETARSLGHHLARQAGMLLGARAGTLPPAARRRLSEEGRS